MDQTFVTGQEIHAAGGAPATESSGQAGLQHDMQITALAQNVQAVNGKMTFHVEARSLTSPSYVAQQRHSSKSLYASFKKLSECVDAVRNLSRRDRADIQTRHHEWAASRKFGLTTGMKRFSAPSRRRDAMASVLHQPLQNPSIAFSGNFEKIATTYLEKLPALDQRKIGYTPLQRRLTPAPRPRARNYLVLKQIVVPENKLTQPLSHAAIATRTNARNRYAALNQMVPEPTPARTNTPSRRPLARQLDLCA